MEALKLLNRASHFLKSKEINSHRIDSELLLSEVLDKSREDLIINIKKNVAKNEITKFNKLVGRRSLKEPIAYIFNTQTRNRING